MTKMDYFLELYGALPRGGPGDNASTRRAFAMMVDLPAGPRILDLGCGPGMQTLELLRISKGTVVALDELQLMIRRVQEAAAKAGFGDRLEVVQADMNDPAFPPSSFDVVWAEGSIYVVGFEAGLAKVKPLVRTGGYVAVTEAVWLRSDPPAEARKLWEEYPGIDRVENKLDVVSRLGYERIGHFVLPASSWTEHYYDPLARRVAEYAPEWKGIGEAEHVLQEARTEIGVFERCSDSYGYAFFVMRK